MRRALHIAAALLSVAFVMQSGAEAIVLDRVVAVVNKEPITWLELNKELRAEIAPRIAGMPEEEVRALLAKSEAAYLERVIARKLQLQEAARLRLMATDADVDTAVENIRQRYNVDMPTFKRSIAAEGLTWADYRKMLSEQISVTRLVDREVKSGLTVADPEVRAAMKDSGNTFRLRRAFFKGSEEALNRKVGEFMDSLARGAAFEELAQRYSESPDASSGGDLGTVRSDQLSEAFLDAIKDLKPGQVSAPILLKGGAHIVQVVERFTPEESALEAVFQKRLRLWFRSVRDRAYIEIKL